MGKMQLIVDQWSDEENEVEEVGLQRKKGIQRFSDIIHTDLEGGDLQQETIDVNLESILQSGNDIILPPSDSPSISEDPISLKIVKSENGRVGIIKENDEERKELYMERVFEIPPRYLFFCPNCRTNIRNAYIQHREWEPAITKAIMCPNCFVFVIPLLAPIPFGVPALVEEVASNKALEIVKSIVYGGLTELLASLIVVVSAIGTNATILSVVGLALANLIGGLFIFVHNLQELKAKEPKKAENQTEAPVDRYMELLGHRKNFYVHAFIAILSFIVFGLVPPLVYGFSFSENGDKDFKNLGAVVVASLLCITMLSIAKAYTKKSNTFVEYLKTVIYDVSNGAVSSVLSYFQLTSMLSESQGCNKIHESESDQSLEVNQCGAKDTTKSAVNTEVDSGTQEVAIETNDNGIGSIDGNNVTLQDPKGRVAPRKKHFWGDWAVIGGANEASVPKQHETESSSKSSDWRVIMAANNKQQEITLEVKVDGEYTDLWGGPGEEPDTIYESTALIPSSEPALVSEVARNKTMEVASLTVVTSAASADATIYTAHNKALEIVKSIVYGGLTESLASLTVVTSAASADASILSIVALVLANLISGLFIFVHDYYLQLGELKDEQHRRSENQTEASVDKYNELLRKRKNLYLHAFITIISFIVSGLVPPVVYGFSFHENGDNDFKKLIAVVGVSLLCITLLSIAKAYTQRPNTYFKTVIYYVSSGAVCLVLSYLAGDLVKKLLEKVSWLEPSSNFGLHVQGMSVQKTEWSS